MYSKKISDHIESQRENMLRDIARLIAIPSVRGEAKPGCPFGEMPAKALAEALEICRECGFETVNVDNAIGFADMNSNPTELGILAHADVVPEGDGWTGDPYKMEYINGNIIGRGTSDDKGPMVAAIYAMKAVKELGIPLSKNVRMIIGSDEECGSGDLPYYFSKYETPKYSFSPDAEFPLINIEKGRFAPAFECEVEDEVIISFDSGIAVNAVPHIATVKLCGVDMVALQDACDDVAAKTGVSFDVKEEGGIITLTANGKAAHASLPELGVNALTATLEVIDGLALESPLAKKLSALLKLYPHGDTRGQGVGVARTDEVSSSLTMSLDILKYDGKKLCGNIDCRMPVTSTVENTADPVVARLEEIGMTVTDRHVTAPHHVDEKLPFVQTLLKMYEKHTGNKGECMAIGGGTYVHNIENGVAFGCVMPEVDTHMHGADEFMPFEDLVTSAKIFADVIVEICK